MLLPSIRDAIISSLTDCGLSVSEIDYTEHLAWEADDTYLTAGIVSQAELMAALGVFLILPFKNSSAVNHDRFYTVRVRAICGRLGLDADQTGILLRLDQ